MENKMTYKFDRIAFLEFVVSSFINKNTPESLDNIYNGFIQLMENSSEEYIEVNKQKKRILDIALEIFKNPKFQELISKAKEEKKLGHREIVTSFTNMLKEKLFTDNKRKYDMSYLYSENSVTSTTFEKGAGMFDFALRLGIEINDHNGNCIYIQPIGNLTGKGNARTYEPIKKYRITMKTPNGNAKQLEIFSRINLFKFQDEEEYRTAICTELLSQNNIELSNTCGYVGEITSTKFGTTVMKVGEDKQTDSAYAYQVSPRYALAYYKEDVSAVVKYFKEQEKKKNDEQMH